MKSISTLLISFLLTFTSFGQLELTQVKDSIYVYTTYRDIGGVPFPSNSMFVVTSEGIVMFDTTWDTKELPKLLDTMKQIHSELPIMCISTHSHEDRTAGVDYLDSIGVPTYSTAETQRICKVNNEEIPKYTISKDTLITIGNHSFFLHYPGWGHASDNIVIYIEKEKLLYGGCFVKSYEAKNLGFTGDANLNSWLHNAKKLKNHFKFKTVITGHQAFDRKKSLRHTIKLLKAKDKEIRNRLKKVNVNF